MSDNIPSKGKTFLLLVGLGIFQLFSKDCRQVVLKVMAGYVMVRQSEIDKKIDELHL